MQQEQQQPSHPGLFKVLRQGDPTSFSSKLVAERDFLKGETIADLTGLTPGPKRYSSVQISPTEHVELNSDLLFEPLMRSLHLFGHYKESYCSLKGYQARRRTHIFLSFH